MTEGELREEVGRVISSVCEERFGAGCCFRDDTHKAVFPELALAMRAEDLDALVSALLDARLFTSLRDSAVPRPKETPQP